MIRDKGGPDEFAPKSRAELVEIILEQRRDLERQRRSYGDALEKVAEVAQALRRTYGLEEQPPIAKEPAAAAVKADLDASTFVPYNAAWRVSELLPKVREIVRKAAPRSVLARQVWIQLGGRPSEPVWYAVTADLRASGEVAFTGRGGGASYVWADAAAVR